MTRKAHHSGIPLATAMAMVASYARGRILDQFRAIAFIIVYLVVFQTLVLRVPITGAVSIAIGIGIVVVGLALFLEGLLLGLMPLGERVGVKLPSRAGIATIALFGCAVGVAATLAEPAIATLRATGGNVTPWDTPLLFVLLHRYTTALVLTVAAGVGVAVALGMVRFYYGLSIKVFVLTLIPTLLVVTLLMSLDSRLVAVVGLAWDSGAVTTGAVTVPLVLALGLGVARASGKREGAATGYGVVMLASAVPVLAVMVLGYALSGDVPEATTEQEFFSERNRETALQLFEDSEALETYLLHHAGEAGWRAFYGDRWSDHVIGRRSAERTSEGGPLYEAAETDRPATGIVTVLLQEWSLALRAVVPVTALLLVVLLLGLRDRPRYFDELILGVVLALVGMTLVTGGIRLGLTALGDEVGRQLPLAFRAEERDAERIIIENFDTDLVLESVSTGGERRAFFYLRDEDGLRHIEFHPERFDETRGSYVHVVRRTPLFSAELSLLGIVLVLLFAFGMGYGATLAEPALNALGRNVEDSTVGTVRRVAVVRAVSIGVGSGLTAGVIRILFELPIIWILAPTYLLLMALTLASDEEFAAIAWDSGGVTTGPITVPLVLSMGLGIGGELGVVDGFGILALASAFPILMVLLYGMIISAQQRKAVRITEEERADER